MSQCTLSQEIYSIFSFVNFRTGDIARNFHGKFIALSFWWCFIMRFTSFFHRVFPYRCFIASWTPKFGTHWNIDSIRGEMNETYGLDSHAKVGGKNWRPMSFFRLGIRWEKWFTVFFIIMYEKGVIIKSSIFRRTLNIWKSVILNLILFSYDFERCFWKSEHTIIGENLRKSKTQRRM